MWKHPEKPDSLGFSVLDVTQSSFFANSSILKAFFKTNSDSCLATQLPEVVIRVGANKNLTEKNLKGKMGNEIFSGHFENL